MVSSTPRPHFTPRKDIVQEAGWAPGPVWTSGKSRPHGDSIPNCPARSQLLYRLSYPAHLNVIFQIKLPVVRFVIIGLSNVTLLLKVKLKLCLCAPFKQRLVKVVPPLLLTSTLNGSQWSALGFAPLLPSKESPIPIE